MRVYLQNYIKEKYKNSDFTFDEKVRSVINEDFPYYFSSNKSFDYNELNSTQSYDDFMAIFRNDKYQVTTFYFKNKEDATLFKLYFG